MLKEAYLNMKIIGKIAFQQLMTHFKSRRALEALPSCFFILTLKRHNRSISFTPFHIIQESLIVPSKGTRIGRPCHRVVFY